MRVLCEKCVLDLVVETRMQQGILGFVKRNYSLSVGRAVATAFPNELQRLTTEQGTRIKDRK